MKKTVAIPFILTLILLLSGCASIVSKKAYPVSITTKPSGASITVTNPAGKEVYKGVSPATIMLRPGAGYFQKADYLVKLSSPSFPDKTVAVKSKINGWYFGNIVSGLLLGFLIIDPLTGAMWKIHTANINEDLSQSATSLTSPAGSSGQNKHH